MKKAYPYLNKDGSKDRRYYPNHVRKKKRRAIVQRPRILDFESKDPGSNPGGPTGV